MFRFVLLSFSIYNLVLQGLTLHCNKRRCLSIEVLGELYLPCCIGDLTIDNSTDIERIQFPAEKVITLLNANITVLSPQILTRMHELVHLSITSGNIKEVHITPSLESLSITYCSLEHLVIDRSQHYSLQLLTIQERQIQYIPETIGHLRNLRLLAIYGGKIKHLDLAIFKDLSKLEELGITNGILITVTTSASIDLPNLKTLQLSGHYFTQLDISQWTMPNVNSFNVGFNLLKRIDHLTETFPQLKRIGFGDNDLDCEWVEKDLSKLFERGVYEMDAAMVGEFCEGEVVRGVCCNVNHSSVHYRRRQFIRGALLLGVEF